MKPNIKKLEETDTSKWSARVLVDKTNEIIDSLPPVEEKLYHCPSNHNKKAYPCEFCQEVPRKLEVRSEESWEVEFGRKFSADKIWIVPSKDNIAIMHDIKSFISNLLAKEREGNKKDTK